MPRWTSAEITHLTRGMVGLANIMLIAPSRFYFKKKSEKTKNFEHATDPAGAFTPLAHLGPPVSILRRYSDTVLIIRSIYVTPTSVSETTP
jgi:hypothetical protein